MSNTTRKERHILVDVLAITGGGLVADAISHHNWLSILGGIVIITIALWLDRRNTLEEDRPALPVIDQVHIDEEARKCNYFQPGDGV
jgi:hypothetical protein